MEEWRDVLGYQKLPGWEESRTKTIDVSSLPVQQAPKWLSYVMGMGACFGVLMVCQLAIAIASHDLRGYRARALDAGAFASVPVSVVAGVFAWRKTND